MKGASRVTLGTTDQVEEGCSKVTSGPVSADTEYIAIHIRTHIHSSALSLTPESHTLPLLFFCFLSFCHTFTHRQTDRYKPSLSLSLNLTQQAFPSLLRRW